MAFGPGQWIAAIALWTATSAAAPLFAAAALEGPAAPAEAAPLPAQPNSPAALPDTRPASWPAEGAESTSPPKPAAVSAADRPLSPRGPKESQGLTAKNRSSDAVGWWQTLGALTLVLGLIFLARWAIRRRSKGFRSARVPQVVEMISRTSVSPRHQVMLIRVGARLLVVGAGADSMNTLAEIDDPEQVSELLGAVEQAKVSSLSNTFAKALAAWRGQTGQSDEGPGDDGAGSAPTPAGHALDRVKNLVERLRQDKPRQGGHP